MSPEPTTLEQAPIAEANKPVEAEEIITAPRTWQLAIVAFYPVLVVVGSVASLTASDSYFGDKHNILNRLFVKRGWFWFTLVFWTSYFTRNVKAKRQLQHVAARYFAATVWWVFFTQWLFGAPLMDRIFLWTGGSCDVTDSETSYNCRKHGGKWEGGHDPSGHVFLLVQSSLVMWMEILPTLWHYFQRRPNQAGAVSTSERLKIDFGIKLPLVLLTLWAWMLLMTALYFHSFSEKLTGLLFGLAEVTVVYIWGESQPWGFIFGVN